MMEYVGDSKELKKSMTLLDEINIAIECGAIKTHTTLIFTNPQDFTVHTDTRSIRFTEVKKIPLDYILKAFANDSVSKEGIVKVWFSFDKQSRYTTPLYLYESYGQSHKYTTKMNSKFEHLKLSIFNQQKVFENKKGETVTLYPDTLGCNSYKTALKEYDVIVCRELVEMTSQIVNFLTRIKFEVCDVTVIRWAKLDDGRTRIPLHTLLYPEVNPRHKQVKEISTRHLLHLIGKDLELLAMSVFSNIFRSDIKGQNGLFDVTPGHIGLFPGVPRNSKEMDYIDKWAMSLSHNELVAMAYSLAREISSRCNVDAPYCEINTHLSTHYATSTLSKLRKIFIASKFNTQKDSASKQKDSASKQKDSASKPVSLCDSSKNNTKRKLITKFLLLPIDMIGEITDFFNNYKDILSLIFTSKVIHADINSKNFFGARNCTFPLTCCNSHKYSIHSNCCKITEELVLPKALYYVRNVSLTLGGCYHRLSVYLRMFPRLLNFIYHEFTQPPICNANGGSFFSPVHDINKTAKNRRVRCGDLQVLYAINSEAFTFKNLIFNNRVWIADKCAKYKSVLFYNCVFENTLEINSHTVILNESAFGLSNNPPTKLKLGDGVKKLIIYDECLEIHSFEFLSVKDGKGPDLLEINFQRAYLVGGNKRFKHPLPLKRIQKMCRVVRVKGPDVYKDAIKANYKSEGVVQPDLF